MENQRKRGMEMIIEMNGCPFEPDSKNIILHDKDVTQIAEAATGSLLSAALLFSTAFVDTPDANSVGYVRAQMFNSVIEAIAALNNTSFETAFEKIKTSSIS